MLGCRLWFLWFGPEHAEPFLERPDPFRAVLHHIHEPRAEYVLFARAFALFGGERELVKEFADRQIPDRVAAQTDAAALADERTPVPALGRLA